MFNRRWQRRKLCLLVRRPSQQQEQEQEEEEEEEEEEQQQQQPSKFQRSIHACQLTFTLVCVSRSTTTDQGAEISTEFQLWCCGRLRGQQNACFFEIGGPKR